VKIVESVSAYLVPQKPSHTKRDFGEDLKGEKLGKRLGLLVICIYKNLHLHRQILQSKHIGEKLKK